MSQLVSNAGSSDTAIRGLENNILRRVATWLVNKACSLESHSTRPSTIMAVSTQYSLQSYIPPLPKRLFPKALLGSPRLRASKLAALNVLPPKSQRERWACQTAEEWRQHGSRPLTLFAIEWFHLLFGSRAHVMRKSEHDEYDRPSHILTEQPV